MRDSRYIILTEAGECACTLGRTAPCADDVIAAAAKMAKAGISGWVAIASHSLQSRQRPVLAMVEPINTPMVSFAVAAAVQGRLAPQAGESAL